MISDSISFHLLQRLKAGVASMTDASRALVSEFVRSQQVEHSAAFMGKNGQPDLYYTSFGWLLSYVLDIPLPAAERKAFLEEHPSANGDLIHEAALVRCLLLHRLMMKGGKLLALLTHAAPALLPLSSYSVPQNDAQCPYTQFVWLSLLEDAGYSLPKADEVLRALDDYRTEDGGYANVKAAKTATLNATAAALAVRGRLTGWQSDTDLEALRRLQDTMGGFRASALAPIPDLLSTATALFVLRSYHVRPLYDTSAFVEAHWLEQGGFSATLLDDDSDVEYVFYGLLAL